MANDIQKKIIIVGGGIVGNLLHLMLESKGFSIHHFEKKTSANNRIFALSPSSIDWLRSIGLPSDFFDSINDITSMKIFDYAIKNSVTFSCDDLDIKQPAIAYMTKEKDLINAIKKLLNKKKNSEELSKNFEIKKKLDELTLETSGEKYKASILIACDGPNSQVRKKMAINSSMHDFKQTAITFQLKVNAENENEAKQFFLKESILALLPIQKDLVSVVWSCNYQFFEKIKNYDDRAIENELDLILGDFYKDIKKVSKVESFPLSMNRVDGVFKDRVLLVGDAAHFIHPLAGQGLNLGIRDIITIEKLINIENYDDIGLKSFLRKYERARKEDVAQMEFLTAGLNWIFSSKSSILTMLVGITMGVLDKSKLVKQFLIKKAIS